MIELSAIFLFSSILLPIPYAILLYNIDNAFLRDESVENQKIKNISIFGIIVTTLYLVIKIIVTSSLSDLLFSYLYLLCLFLMIVGYCTTLKSIKKPLLVSKSVTIALIAGILGAFAGFAEHGILVGVPYLLFALYAYKLIKWFK